MKIGIVTEPIHLNYGGILQNFALQKVLRDMGHAPVTLDFLPSLSFGRYLLYLAKNLLLYPIPSKRRRIKRYSHFVRRPASVDRFVKGNISLTKPLERYSLKVLRKNGVEALIVGSDQVWRKEYNPFLEDMYLSFAAGYDCRKIAYAASFGVEKWDYPEKLTKSCSRLVSKFDSISVREESACRLIREHLSVDAELVLDPTLLLDGDDYAQLSSSYNVGDEKYVVAYILDATDEKNSFIDYVAASLGAMVKFVTVTGNCECPIDEWLSLIRKAEYVITDSFHGSAFSILFRRQFVAFVNKERGADRFTTLFHGLALENRLVDAVHPDSSVLDSDIDYTEVEPLLASMRKKSIEFLSDVLND